MRTVSTFSFGAFIELELPPVVVAPAPVVDVAPDEGALAERSSVPVISTLCPTCAVNFESSASSLYVLPAEDAADGLVAPAVPVGVVPAAPLEEDAPDPDIVAFARMKFESLELAPVDPVVPVAPAVALEPRWTHPVTVT